jgi:hypothetical protein
MYKLTNAKLYNRLLKSITHIAKSKMEVLADNTFVISQKPTQPLLLMLCEMLSEWLALNETVLIVSGSFSEISSYLNEKGFKTAKITDKTDEKNLSKRSIVCCSPLGACSDLIKNYAFTRVVIEGAQKVNETMTTLAIDKGCKKLYLIGDSKLPDSPVLSNFAANRGMSTSLYSKACQNKVQYNFPENVEQHFFENSVLKTLSTFFYDDSLSK